MREIRRSGSSSKRTDNGMTELSGLPGSEWIWDLQGRNEEAEMEKNREGPKGFRPGPDNNQIVERLIAITAKDENHAKVRRRKDGCLIISAVSEKLVS